jgi:hypothetical protein
MPSLIPERAYLGVSLGYGKNDQEIISMIVDINFK